MLIERAAYGNRWRAVSPAAKGLFALAGLGAALLACSPTAAAMIAGLLMVASVLGASVPLALYLRVATPALGFLALSSLSLLFSLSVDAAGQLSWQIAPAAAANITAVGGRSLAALAALLGLVLTTPLPDLIALLRRLHVPDVLLDLMVLCYRMLFVFSTAIEETRTAQAARLGYSTPRRGLNSLGLLAAGLSVQVWQRARALHLAAEARCGSGTLRFLTPQFQHAGRDTALAGLAGSLLLAIGASAR
jgi:cobalt/nickel transport system permease protein